MSNFQLFTLPDFESWIKRQSVTRLIKLIQNHHTYIPNYSHFFGNNHLALQKNMERFHMVERGFSAIAQHFTTFPDGTIMTGRALDMIPAGIKGANKFGICIEHLGNFDANGDKMSDNHKATIIGINALLCERFGLPPSDQTIVYHHWYDLNTGQMVTEGQGATKSCPGTNFFGGNTKVDFNANLLPQIVATMRAATENIGSQHKHTGVVSPRKLNVRRMGSLDAPVVTTVTMGTPVRIFDEVSGWYAINGTKTEWVKKEFIVEVEPA